MTPKKEAFLLDSEYDDLKISVITLVPEKPRATISFLHGMCEHKERYIPIMEYLADLGYACIIHDHRGHGESVKSPDDLGDFYEGGFNSQIEDSGLVNEYISNAYPTLPHYMFGHSMGSLVARAYIKRHDNKINGLLISGCPSYNSATPCAKILIKIMIMLFGKRHRSPFMKKLLFGSFNNLFDNVISENDWICSNPETVSIYDSDPLCGFTFTLSGYYNLILLTLDTYNVNNWVVKHPGLPIHFISGEDDPCLISRDNFIKAIKILQTVGYKNISYRLFPRMRHEILNETDSAVVFSEISERLELFTNKE